MTLLSPTNRKQILRTVVLLIVLGLAVHFLLPQIESFRKSFHVIGQMRTGFVLLAVLAEIASYLGAGYILYSLAAIYKQKFPIWMGFLVIMASASVGLVAGGMFGSIVAISRWTRRQGIDLKTATLAGIIPSFLNTSFITLLAFFSLAHLLVTNELSILELIIFIVTLLLLILGVGLAIWGIKNRDSFLKAGHQLTNWIKQRFHRPLDNDVIVERIQKSFAAWDEIRYGKWHLPLLGGLIYLFFDMVTLYFTFIAAGHPIRIIDMLAGYGLPLLMGKAAFILPGGLGIIEATMAAIYSGLGVPSTVALAVVLVYRFITFWAPTVLGFIIMVGLYQFAGKSGEKVATNNQ